MVRIERPPHLPQDDLACDNRDCTMFTVVLPGATGQRLSDAAALARAVGVLGQGVDRVEFRQWIEGWGSRAWSVREEIAGPKGPRTLAATLIALAGEVGE
jgi:hypothetical protein